MDKSQLRKELIKRRDGFVGDISAKKQADNNICDNTMRFIENSGAKKILCYISIGTEPDTRELIEKLLTAGYIVYSPVCEDKKGNMIFCKLSSLSEIENGIYGTVQPKQGSEKLNDFTDSICIVPGLSFDRKGHRIGYGGGYYDRFLKNYSGKTVGLCYNICIVDDTMPQSHDISTDIVITDEWTSKKLT